MSGTPRQGAKGAMYDFIFKIPVAIVSLAVTVLVLTFNMGFFSVIGLAFIPLFTFQEHLVFSLGGASIIIVLLSGLLLLALLSSFLLGSSFFRDT